MTMSVVMTIISNSDYPIIIMWGSYTEQQEYKWDYLNICRCVCYKSVYGFWASKSKSTNDYLDLQCVCVYVHSHFKDGTYEWFNSTWCYRLSISPVNVSFKDLIQ